MISATPCGRIPHVDELFGCETINQVHGSIIEFLGNLNPENRAKFRVWLFDDMCHLKPHSEKPQIANQNEVTKMFAELPKAVDKFHFPGHKKTDKYCQEACNPNKVLKDLNIEKLNSPACEQAFKWLNEFKNIKSMNEPRFKFYLLYMIDLHNLHIEGQVQVKANPLNIDREVILANKKTEIMSKDFDKLETAFDTMLVLNQKEETFEDCFDEKHGQLQCKFCPGSYKKEGHLRNHLESKHNKKFKIICSNCSSQFPDSNRLTRHKKSCK